MSRRGTSLAWIAVALACTLAGVLLGDHYGKRFGFREACAQVGGEVHTLDDTRVCVPKGSLSL